jgi:hypothetical protein
VPLLSKLSCAICRPPRNRARDGHLAILSNRTDKSPGDLDRGGESDR